MNKSKLVQILCSMLMGVLLVIIVMAALILSGIISLNKTDITISTESGENLYDGAPLTNHNWHLTKGMLKKGHRITVTFTGTQTSVGESPNTVEITIIDELGADVTSDYNIDYDLGTLKVNPRPIAITSASDEKYYDGTPLINHSFEITDDHYGLVHGHKATVVITGSITDAGFTTNTVEAVVIHDRTGANVTLNYQILIHEGILVVTSPFGASSTPSFDGESSLIAGNEFTNTVLYTVYSDVKDTVYLKIRSFGDYTGTGWKGAAVYNKLIDGKYAASSLTSLALKEAKEPLLTISIKSNYQPYALPYYTDPEASGNTVQIDDTACQGIISEAYTVSYYRYKSGIDISGTKYSGFEKEYRKFVNDEYLTVDDESRKYMEGIIAAQKFSANDPDIVSKVASYIQNAASYNLEYDSALDRESNIAIAFLDKYKEGVCRHYASAATLLFRTLGIPARYTIGALAELQANQWNNVTANKAHAWVEVYIKGLGWINVEVTGSSGQSGSVGGNTPSNNINNKPKLNIYPETVRKLYDGKPIYAENKIAGFEEFEKLGYTYDVEVVGERTELGITLSTIKELTLYNTQGEDVTSSFNIKLFAGVVQVYTKIVYFGSDSYTITYDGKPLKPGALTNSELLEGHRYEVTSTAKVNAGIQLNTYDVKIFDEKGNDVTEIYYVSRSYGVVDIRPLEITVKAGDATKKYDGTPLTCDELSIIEGSLQEGHTISFYVITGTQTEVGRSENAIEYITIQDKYGNDITPNYVINYKLGKLRVTP